MAMQAQIHTISGLAVELRRDRRAIAQALSTVPPDGEVQGKRGWLIATAIEALDARLNTSAEKARLDKLRADAVELELARKRGELVSLAEVMESDQRLTAALRAKLHAVPARVAAEIPDQSTP